MARVRHLDDVATVNITVGGRSFQRQASAPAEDDSMCVTLQSIAVTPSSISGNEAETHQLVATGTWSDGSTMNLTSAVTWSVDNTGIATITNGTSGGLMTLGGGGATIARATLLTVVGTCGVSVNSTPIAHNLSGAIITAHQTIGPRVYTRPFYLPSDAADIELYISNRHLTGTYPDVTGVNAAVYTSDPTASNKVTGTPNKNEGFTYTAPTAPGVGEWFKVMDVTVAAGADGKRVLALSVSAAGDVSYYQLNHHGWYNSGTETVDPLAAPTAQAEDGPYNIQWRYTTLKRRIVVLGDSISVGATVSGILNTGYEDSAYYRMMLDNDWAVDIEGRAGATLQQLAEYGTYFREWDGPNFDNADVIIERWVNDLATRSTAQIQADMATAVDYAITQGARAVYVVTAIPALAYIGANATRVAVNSWLTGGSHGLNATVIDLDSSLRDPATPSQILPLYDANLDGTHPSTAGQIKIQELIEAALQ